MIGWLDKHLVPGWRDAWRRWSVWAAASAGAGVSAILAQPHLLFTLLNYMPADPTQRAVAAVGIGAIVWFAPSILVLLRQSNLMGKTDEQA